MSKIAPKWRRMWGIRPNALQQPSRTVKRRGAPDVGDPLAHPRESGKVSALRRRLAR